MDKLIGVDWGGSKLYLNIDPLPSRDKVDETISVAKEYFGTVITRTPDVPNFTSAVQWCWREVEEKMFLHLEDDWVLTKRMNLKYLLKFFDKIETKQVVLRAYPRAYKKMCLSPSIILSDFAKRFDFDTATNPEIQLRTNFVKSKNICTPHSKKTIVVKDIGRAWLDNQDFSKPKTKARFTSWIKEEE